MDPLSIKDISKGKTCDIDKYLIIIPIITYALLKDLYFVLVLLLMRDTLCNVLSRTWDSLSCDWPRSVNMFKSFSAVSELLMDSRQGILGLSLSEQAKKSVNPDNFCFGFGSGSQVISLAKRFALFRIFLTRDFMFEIFSRSRPWGIDSVRCGSLPK